MSIKYKDIHPSLMVKIPIKMYKEWNISQFDFGYNNNKVEWDDEVNNPNIPVPNHFPTPSVRYAKINSDMEEPDMVELKANFNDDPYDVDNVYNLSNGTKFSPSYELMEGLTNPDGTYYRSVYYSIKHLFYSSIVYKPINGQILNLLNEAIVFDFPRNMIADGIDPNTFTMNDVSNINELPYSNTGDFTASPFDNYVGENVNAIKGISLFDDGKGNIYDANYNINVIRGNVFYNQGVVVITDIYYARYFKKYILDEVVT